MLADETFELFSTWNCYEHNPELLVFKMASIASNNNILRGMQTEHLQHARKLPRKLWWNPGRASFI